MPADSDALGGLAQGFAAQVAFDAEPLQRALQEMVADAWVVGAKDATEHVTNATGALAATVVDVDWSRWRPGHPLAADRLAGAGFDALLSDARVTLRDIDDITRRRIGHALEEGVREGQSVQQMASALTDVLHDPARSEVIAVTEVNRAMTSASRQVYADNGVGAWDLLTAPGACPTCVAVAAANPHPMSDTAGQPPLHPRCRCALMAHI